jgi:phosphate:Na+ symporter
MLDERFFERPTFAVAQVVKVANRMAELSKECLVLAGEVLIGKYNREKIDQVIGIERSIDKYEDKLGSYLVQLSSKSLNQQDSETLSQIFECIGSFERISDHARNIAELKEVMNEKELQFTDKANSEIEKYVTAVSDIVTMTVDAYVAKDEAKLHEIEAFEEAIDNIDRKAKKHHIKRLQKGKCAIANSVIIEDLYINLERIADHCSNVAATMIQVNEDDALENHVYVNALKAGEATDFKAAVKEYTKKYSL